MELLDRIIAWMFIPVASWILWSGLDDLLLDLVCLWRGRANFAAPQGERTGEEGPEVAEAPQKRCAIFVPCWREEDVIVQMVTHNLSRLDYSNFDVFLGVYPNDPGTVARAEALARQWPRVHVVVTPKPGPTSKADCLNAIFAGMNVYEQEARCRFEILVLHDAEDLIHPRSLHWINYYSDSYAMVQVPVLPLPTPAWELVHGTYCDEFAEFQSKDMRGRQILNGFIPSTGVGTGFSRDALENLKTEEGHLFREDCLTEDYEIGIRLHRLGYRQYFMPIRYAGGQAIATREYFPRTCRGAIRQRTRWITGISLQSWERHGWFGNAGTLYWLWRDRKGLVGNPASLLTSFLLVYGSLTWCGSVAAGEKWRLGGLLNESMALLLMGTSLLQAVRLGVRAWCSAGVYGWRFASLVPLRALMGNYVNGVATFNALARYAASRMGIRPLTWLKTAHTFPDVIPPQPAAESLAPARHLATRRAIARSLPLELTRRLGVIPFDAAGGRLFLASPAPVDQSILRQLRTFTTLTPEFRLVTQAHFQRLSRELMG